ncbi:MAG: hypothetical protein C3F12_07810 [Candidatus Methylomirabilota bacterium]|nr:MAG: hypothetical protein C3F12_07810 [candidate division NC10 bacterium]
MTGSGEILEAFGLASLLCFSRFVAVIPAKPASRARAGIQEITGVLDSRLRGNDDTWSIDFFIGFLIQDTRARCTRWQAWSKLVAVKVSNLFKEDALQTCAVDEI